MCQIGHLTQIFWVCRCISCPRHWQSKRRGSLPRTTIWTSSVSYHLLWLVRFLCHQCHPVSSPAFPRSPVHILCSKNIVLELTSLNLSPDVTKNTCYLITGNAAHYGIIKQGQFVHLDDLCMGHIFLFENPKAEGRYLCSASDATIHDVAKLLREKYPEYNIPTK